MQIQVFAEHFGFSVMLSGIPMRDVFFMQPSGKWKLLLTTSSMCYTKFKQSTTVINYERSRVRVCVCVIFAAAVIVETTAGCVGNIFFTSEDDDHYRLFIYHHVLRTYLFIFLLRHRKSFYRSESIPYATVYSRW
jgi:hypothetical protein